MRATAELTDLPAAALNEQCDRDDQREDQQRLRFRNRIDRGRDSSRSELMFPGTILINSPQVLEFFQIVPVSVGKSIVRHACYARMDLSVPGNKEMFDMTWESAHSIVLRQDLPYGVTTAHAGITDKAMPKFMFGENELALQYMHRQVKRALAEMR